MERELEVYLQIAGGLARVGRLWAHVRGSRESASFEYDPTWLDRRDAFALDPELPLSRGTQHTGRPLFNAFTDPAPDRFGQALLRRYERARARRERRTPRTLFAVDFLSCVDDEARLGALHLKDPGAADFLASGGPRIPPLIDLPQLLSATTRVLAEEESDEDLRLVLAPGTSLGGARPKASVRDKDGHLLIAKFPRLDDEWPVTRWEATALALARDAAVEVPHWRLELVLKKPVLVLRRFDRRGRGGLARVPVQSALTALAASDHEVHGYVEVAEALRRDGAEVMRDLRQLWRRMVFNVLVSNTDDHLRNHAFLRDRRGWRLAPAYDLNPTPVDVRPRVQVLTIGTAEGESSLEETFAVAVAFGIATPDEARTIAAEVGHAVARWRQVAATLGIKPREAERMASAFEHEDLQAAVRAMTRPRHAKRHTGRSPRSRKARCGDRRNGRQPATPLPWRGAPRCVSGAATARPPTGAP
jgi:serine/threonine-protein kinase HipA